MTDDLEAELRAAFARRAGEVSPDAVERLRRTDYRPRPGRRWPLTVGALGAASGTAAVVSIVVLGGTQTAFAGWSAAPSTPAEVHAAAAPGNCQAQVATAPGGSGGQGSWTQVATDARGPYTMAVYERGDSLASCFTGPSFETVEAESLDAAHGRMAVSVSGSAAAPRTNGGAVVTGNTVGLLTAGDIDQLLVSHLSQAGQGPYTLVEGRLAPTVTAVTLVCSDGREVTATTGSGWLVAWWPGGADVTAARVTTAGGTTTEPLGRTRFPSPPPPTNGAAAPVHGAPSSGPPGPVGGSGSPPPALSSGPTS